MSEGPVELVLPVDKPEGPTSHDVVSAARKALGVKRVGHTGTLDPFASGLLLLCVGRATRLAEYFSGLDKSYEAVARLGQRTDSLDRDGAVVDESEEWRTLTAERIREAAGRFVGEIDQVPPAYSAKKVAGERAYRLAREGERVELEPCRVRVDSLEVTEVELPLVTFRVTCSSGTYVRSLARDIGDALGVGAHLTGLRRTAIGAWSVADALPMDELADADRVARHARSPLDALGHLPRVEVDAEVAGRLSMGQAVRLDGVGAGERTGPGEAGETGDAGADRAAARRADAEGSEEGTPVAVAHAGLLLAVAETRDGMLRPKKVFAA